MTVVDRHDGDGVLFAHIERIVVRGAVRRIGGRWPFVPPHDLCPHEAGPTLWSAVGGRGHLGMP